MSSAVSVRPALPRLPRTRRTRALAASVAAVALAGGIASCSPPSSPQTIARNQLVGHGWGNNQQFGCLNNLWMRESGWRINAMNPYSGAYGIPQALPGSKMGASGANWRYDASTQIRWGLDYIGARYGSPCGAWGHSMSYGWY